MKNFLSIFLSFLFAFSVLSSTVSVSAVENRNTEQISFDVFYCQTEARKMLGLVNAFRASDETYIIRNGKKVDMRNLYKEQEDKDNISRPLEYNYSLEKLAMQRAAELVVHYSHLRPYDNWTDEERGFYSSENIGNGSLKTFSSAKQVFNYFKEDYGELTTQTQAHRINMANPYWRSVAFACVKKGNTCYWVQAFSEEAPNETSSVKTEASDIKTNVKCEVLTADITNKITINEKTSAKLTVLEGKSKKIPVVNVIRECFDLTISKKKIIPTIKGNNKKAIVKNGKIVGKKVGTTKFTLSFGTSQNAIISVVVKHNYKPVKTIKPTAHKNGKKIYKCKHCKKKKTVTILPSLSNVKLISESGWYELSWKKAKGVSGYEIQQKIGEETSTTNETYTSFSGNAKTGTICKFRVRSYKRLKNGQKIYSAWTKWKKVIVK